MEGDMEIFAFDERLDDDAVNSPLRHISGNLDLDGLARVLTNAHVAIPLARGADRMTACPTTGSQAIA